MRKILSIDAGLTEIEKIDLSIASFLESDDYAAILLLMKDRLTLISELTRIKNDIGINAQEKHRLDQIFSGANNIMQKIQSKQDKIGARLDKSRKINSQNKNIGYK